MLTLRNLPSLADHLNPCQDGGIFVQLHHDYFCICPKEFRGRNCEGKSTVNKYPIDEIN